MKRFCLSKIPKWIKPEPAPAKGLQISKVLLATTIMLPLMLVGSDMVSDGSVLAQMWQYMVQVATGADTRIETSVASEIIAGVMLSFLFGVSFTILVLSNLNLLWSNPLASLLRNARTTVMLNSRELERKDVPVPLGNSWVCPSEEKTKKI